MTAEEELIQLRQENSQLREQVKQLTEEVKRLQEQQAKTARIVRCLLPRIALVGKEKHEVCVKRAGGSKVGSKVIQVRQGL